MLMGRSTKKKEKMKEREHEIRVLLKILKANILPLSIPGPTIIFHIETAILPAQRCQLLTKFPQSPSYNKTSQ